MASVAKFDTWQSSDGTNVARFSGGELQVWDGAAWITAGGVAPYTISYLAIAGGGGGGKYLAGGGGAGGYLESNFTLSAGTYSLKVGAGGAGGATNDGSDGTTSVFSTATATGGGGGGGANRSGRAGASSGGLV